jgi:integrase
MTATALSAEQPVTEPGPDSVVLAARKLRPGTDPATLSRFREERWYLTPALFAEHADSTAIDHATVPEPFRHQVKVLTWLMINHDLEADVAFYARSSMPAIRTVRGIWRYLRDFTIWLDQRGIARFGEVTDAVLDAFALHVKNSPVSHETREDMLGAVARVWVMRELMPAADRLPEAPPWGGDRLRDILGQGRVFDENRTPRIHPVTMTALLSWSLRFVEQFADDITAAFHEYNHLSTRNARTRIAREGKRTPQDRRSQGTLTAMAEQLLGEYRDQGRALPGRREPDGTVVANVYFLSVQLDVQLDSRRFRKVIAQQGLPIDDDTYLSTPVRATLDGKPWRTRPIPYEQAQVLARHLSTACYVVIAYLSGQRPGETANLERGCIEHDDAADLLLLRGRHWKGVRGPDGNHEPEGEIRPDPWVTVTPVERAVRVLERLHDARLLFPNTLFVNGRGEAGCLKERVGRARGQSLLSLDINRLIRWINEYCEAAGRTDPIPPDPVTPEITPSRLRRTLAWFIVRQPRGLVATAIQYGHVKVKMTLGYSGSYASGFPDDLAFEQWLERIDTLADAHARLADGELVSGPAADEYRARVEGGARFAGRAVRTAREANTLLANPDLQIFPGKGMTCVLDPAKAACRLTGDERGTRATPDLDDCKPHCANIARTDRDIDYLHQRAQALRTAVQDPLAPTIRHAREQRELDRITQLITRHPTPEST